MPEQLLRECVTYFKERSVYQVLFQKIREKYYSLGYLGGSVTLTGVSLEAKQQLSGFFQKDFRVSDTGNRGGGKCGGEICVTADTSGEAAPPPGSEET